MNLIHTCQEVSKKVQYAVCIQYAFYLRYAEAEKCIEL